MWAAVEDHAKAPVHLENLGMPLKLTDKTDKSAYQGHEFWSEHPLDLLTKPTEGLSCFLPIPCGLEARADGQVRFANRHWARPVGPGANARVRGVQSYVSVAPLAPGGASGRVGAKWCDVEAEPGKRETACPPRRGLGHGGRIGLN